MIEIVKRTIQSRQLIQPGDGIVIGLSGGADSTALLAALCALRTEWDLKLHAVHVNHLFRGALADRDEAYAKALCLQFDVPFTSFRTDVAALAAAQGKSFELAGREVRYAHFESVRQTEAFQKIAVAHHLDDQGETVLMRLIRGSGLEGLTGIRPSRGGVIIRPLFDCSRQQIESYCAARGLEPMVDHTNADSAYNRNFIRNEIVPCIDKRFGGSLNRQLARTAELLAEDASFMAQAVEAAWQAQVRREKSGLVIDLASLHALHPAIGKRLVRQLFSEVSGNLIDLEQCHVQQIIALTDRNGCKQFCYRGVCFSAEHGCLTVKTAVLAEAEPTLIITRVSQEEMQMSPASRTHIYVDETTVNGTLFWRHRQPGDKFVPMGMKGHKKLKDFFIDQKVPLDERDRIWLLCDAEKIIWVCGLRQNAETQVTKNTGQILKLSLSDVVTTV